MDFNPSSPNAGYRTDTRKDNKEDQRKKRKKPPSRLRLLCRGRTRHLGHREVNQKPCKNVNQCASAEASDLRHQCTSSSCSSSSSYDNITQEQHLGSKHHRLRSLFSGRSSSPRLLDMDPMLSVRSKPSPGPPSTLGPVTELQWRTRDGERAWWQEWRSEW
eukprot:755107-Hanusia_phi.AAC.1